MYSKSAWGGPTDPFILTVFPNVTIEGDADPIVSLIIFEWRDEQFIGVPRNDGTRQKDYICNPQAVEGGFCNETDIGEWILADNATEKSANLILTKAVHLKDSSPIHYDITKTGYYCVGAFSYTDNDFVGVVEFREAYGELPATQIPKLPFYGGITILYAVVAVYVDLGTTSSGERH
jgi:hypothetical protein